MMQSRAHGGIIFLFVIALADAISFSVWQSVIASIHPVYVTLTSTTLDALAVNMYQGVLFSAAFILCFWIGYLSDRSHCVRLLRYCLLVLMLGYILLLCEVKFGFKEITLVDGVIFCFIAIFTSAHYCILTLCVYIAINNIDCQNTRLDQGYLIAIIFISTYSVYRIFSSLLLHFRSMFSLSTLVFAAVILIFIAYFICFLLRCNIQSNISKAKKSKMLASFLLANLSLFKNRNFVYIIISAVLFYQVVGISTGLMIDFYTSMPYPLSVILLIQIAINVLMFLSAFTIYPVIIKIFSPQKVNYVAFCITVSFCILFKVLSIIGAELAAIIVYPVILWFGMLALTTYLPLLYQHEKRKMGMSFGVYYAITLVTWPLVYTYYNLGIGLLLCVLVLLAVLNILAIRSLS
ncbi:MULTISPECIES: hypothetical protein [Cysteiniphilum]|uniref:hypothetical protein n=1 Tax=Cysteiniphilum TaxID=2056696 RepID=UPI00178730D7|nr:MULTISPECIES: hypothetical protein [Cysteiniphilum]